MYLRCFDLSAFFSVFLPCEDVGYAIHDMCKSVSQKCYICSCRSLVFSGTVHWFEGIPENTKLLQD